MGPATRRAPRSDAEAIARDVAHARQIAEAYVSAIPGGAPRLAGAEVLELGPGPSCGATAWLTGFGARLTVADPYLGDWDETYHPAFFRALRNEMLAANPGADCGAIDGLVEADGFNDRSFRRWQAGAESLPGPDAAFDIVLSWAVLEHVRDVPRALAEVGRVTRIGGAGVHLVDFRDHRDFDRPLEYLTLDGEFFWCMFDARWGECGNRWRYSTTRRAFESAGFHVRFEAEASASPHYARDVQPRLHPDFSSLSPDEIFTLWGRFVCVRESLPARLERPLVAAFDPPAQKAPTPRRIRAHDRIVLYGAGSGALAALDLLDRLDLADRVKAICDGNANKEGTEVAGFRVTRLSDLTGRYDLVIVASEPGREQIATHLAACGLSEIEEFRELGFLGAFAPRIPLGRHLSA